MHIGLRVPLTLRDELLKTKRPKRNGGGDRTLSKRTVVKHLVVVHGVFQYALREHGLDRNPATAKLVERPTVRYSGEFETFDSEELAALARAAENEQDATMYLSAAYTGLRQGEVLALRWRDIDFADQRVHVRRSWSQSARAEKTPKSGKVRSVPLVPELIGPLDRLSQREHFTGEDDLVFCSAIGDHLDAWALRREYNKALKRAGLRRVRFHDLRHVFGSTAAKKFQISDVQAVRATLTSAPRAGTFTTVHGPTTPPDCRKASGATILYRELYREMGS